MAKGFELGFRTDSFKFVVSDLAKFDSNGVLDRHCFSQKESPILHGLKGDDKAGG